MSLKSTSLIAALMSLFFTGAALAAEETKATAPLFTKITSPALSKLWESRPSLNDFGKTIVEFKIDSDGHIENAPTAPSIFQSSGNLELDHFAVQCLEDAAPFRLSQSEKKSLAEHDNICLAKMDAVHNLAFFSGKYFVNYNSYASNLQNSIKPLWITVKSKKPFSARYQFAAKKNGSIENCEIVETSGKKSFDQMCLSAIWRSAPVKGIPDSAPDRVITQVVFVYDPVTNEHKTEIWIDKILRSSESSLIPQRFELPPDKPSAATDVKTQGQLTQQEETAAYMAKLQKNIKRAWFPPSSKDSYKVKCRFIIDASGRLLSIRDRESYEVNLRKKACLQAILNAAPFPSLPSFLKNKIEVEFTFDYDIYKVMSADQSLEEAERRIQRRGSRPQKKPVAILPPYMKSYLDDVQTKIYEKWQRKPEWTQDESLSIIIGKDGSVSDFNLTYVTGDNEEDAAFIEAVKKAIPFTPLPKEAGDSYTAALVFKAK